MSLRADHASVHLGSRLALEDFSCSIGAGELVAVAGANGAGKSTTLKLLAGLILPATGGASFDGTPLQTLGRAALGRRIAYLPQDRTVHWGLATERVVALGRLPHKSFAAADSAEDRAAVISAMSRMDIVHLTGRSVARLSGGERARVLVARALAQDAQYLIADEPTSGLDPAHSLSLFEELDRLVREGKSVVTALHDLSLAARYATRVLLLKDGRCIADGPPAQVLSSDTLATAFGIDAIVSKIDGLPVVLPRSPLRTASPLT